MNSNKILGNKLFKNFFGGSEDQLEELDNNLKQTLETANKTLNECKKDLVETPDNQEFKECVDKQTQFVERLEKAQTNVTEADIIKEVSNEQDDTNIFKEFFENLIYKDDKPCPLIIILLIIFGIIYLLTPTLFPNYFKNIGFFDIIFNILNIVGAIIICGFVSRDGLCDVKSAFTFEFLAHIIAISYPILLLLLHISTVNKKKEKNENINTMTTFANTNNLETSDEALIDNLENDNLDSYELENTDNTNL